MKFRLSCILLALAPSLVGDTAPLLLESACYGTPAAGRLEHGWQLPAAGKNFRAYHWLGAALGRNYIHSAVYAAVTDAYLALEKDAADSYFVYGESGWADGGAFRPHKTHQNGLSVDFFVPVRDSQGNSVTLPISLGNKFGYGIEFDQTGKYGEYSIDFAAMAAHLLALKAAADKHGIGIRRVIFDNALQRQLRLVPEGQRLFAAVAFSQFKPWVRHDEHYHVDFNVPCGKTVKQ